MAIASARAHSRSDPSVTVLIVVAALVLSLSMGVRQSLGLFLQPVTQELGVSAASFGFALALQNLVWGLSQPVIGALGDRFGPRPVLIGSALIYAIGLILMASGGPLLGLDVGGGLLAGIGIAGTGFGVLLGAVGRAVPPERRVQTVGLVSPAGRSRRSRSRLSARRSSSGKAGGPRSWSLRASPPRWRWSPP